MKLRALIVEDEPLARRALHGFMAEVDWLECVGEATDGASAVRAIDSLRPDLVFLDVRMPVLDGLEVLRRIRHAPEVVFTTAFDRYAVAAFELGADDYLVKPFGKKRFQQTLERVRARTQGAGGLPPASERARDALGEAPLQRLFARSGGSITPVPRDAVTRIEARGDYVAIHHPGGPSLMHITLSELEGRLDAERFLRIHRSHVVNLDHVSTIRRGDDRRFSVVLRDGTELVASRTGTLRLRARLP